MNITTIVAIVAFVSLLIVSVIVISSMRQASKASNARIKAIEQSINDVVYELSEMNETWRNTYERIDFEKKREEERKVTEIDNLIEKENEPFDAKPQLMSQGEISLDFADFEALETFEEFDSINLDDIDFIDSMSDTHTEYNTGRSGKKYTAEELETLIKE